VHLFGYYKLLTYLGSVCRGQVQFVSNSYELSVCDTVWNRRTIEYPSHTPSPSMFPSTLAILDQGRRVGML